MLTRKRQQQRQLLLAAIPCALLLRSQCDVQA